MKFRTSALLTAALLLITPLAMSDYDRRLGGNVTQREWAEFYADTAMRQIAESRRARCNFHSGHWSRDYYTHFDWAFRNSRHKGWVVIDRRDEALAKCKRGYGYYYGHNGHDYRYDRLDYRHFWRNFNRGLRHWRHDRHRGNHRPRYDNRYGHDSRRRHDSRGHDDRRGHGRYDRDDRRHDRGRRGDRHDGRDRDRRDDRRDRRGGGG